MRTSLALVILITATIGLFISCTQGAGETVVYPSGWPYPSIKGPDNSTRAKFPENLDIKTFSKDGYTVDGHLLANGDTMYAVVFKCSVSWDELYKNISEQADQSGLMEIKTNPGRHVWVERGKETAGDANEVRLKPVEMDTYFLSITIRHE